MMEYFMPLRPQPDEDPPGPLGLFARLKCAADGTGHNPLLMAPGCL